MRLTWTLAAAILGGLIAAATARPGRYVVRGRSMEPVVHDGDRLLVLRGCRWYVQPRIGSLVLARPVALRGREVIKRVASMEPGVEGARFTLLGDNAVASTDSRHFGSVTAAEITARVWLRYWPDERRGRVC